MIKFDNLKQEEKSKLLNYLSFENSKRNFVEK